MTTSFFKNDQLIIDDLPKVENLVFQDMERDYLKVSLMIASIFAFIFTLAPSILVYFLQDELSLVQCIVILGTGILIASLILWLTYMSYRYKKYALRQKDIVYQSGYIFRSQTVVPFNRIQHCEINQGPLDRLYDLAAIKIFTAGGSYSDLSIPGIYKQTAEDLKHFIIKRTAIGEEE